MTYLQTIQYLESFINYEKIPAYPYKESLKLERIKDFLAAIGNPQESLQCLHIAGSKGKGSTCAFLTYILRQAGYAVGLYTSPHLSDFRERIRILVPGDKPQDAGPEFEGMISKHDLAGLVQRMRPAIEKYNKISPYGPLSFFEVYTSLAFIYFKEKGVDFTVLETGLGGRLDATNVVWPLVCAITPISYEHTQKLGNTLREIATEKAGIIKSQKSKVKSQNLIVVSAPQEEAAGQVIRSRCKEVGAELYEVGKEIAYKRINGTLSVQGIFRDYRKLKVALLGEHQLINASVAVGLAEALKFYGVEVAADSVRAGLYNTRWPGRCEVIARRPCVVLDGAQNVASCRALKEAVREKFQYEKLILVLGISNDKDIPGICRELSEMTDEVVLTRSANPRAASPEELAKYFPDKLVQISRDVREAKELAARRASAKDLILVTGSLFVVGEARDGQFKK
jgi:dihydrofolate synthase/folylpolyglutamate synthase